MLYLVEIIQSMHQYTMINEIGPAVGNTLPAAEKRVKNFPSLRTCCRSSDQTQKVSGFLLCILSPVCRAKLCGEIGEDPRQNLKLEEEDRMDFSQLLALGCGDIVWIVGGLEALVKLGMMAD